MDVVCGRKKNCGFQRMYKSVSGWYHGIRENGKMICECSMY